MRDWKKYWKGLIYLICGLLLIMPYSETFIMEYSVSNGQWIKNYAFTSWEHSAVVIPVIVLLTAISHIYKRTPKKIAMSVLFILSTLAFLAALLLVSMPIQDFVPSWGLFLLILLFPIVAIDTFVKWREIKRVVSQMRTMISIPELLLL
ncbi:MAG: hypothetical protein AAGI23_15060 [Bacteroidota bacterium]